MSLVSLLPIAEKQENVGTKMFEQICKILSNFDSNPLICDPTLFPGKNSRNIANSNRVFSGKGRGDRVLILTYLDSQIADVFPHLCLSFSILGILREKLVVNFANFWSISFLWKLESFKFCLMFLLPRVLPMVRISATLDHIWGSKGPKSSQKWSFYGCLLGT